MNGRSPTNPVPRPKTLTVAWILLTIGLVLIGSGSAWLLGTLLDVIKLSYGPGIVLFFAGQALLLSGIVLQVDCIWQHNRSVARALMKHQRRVAIELATKSPEQDDESEPRRMLRQLKASLAVIKPNLDDRS